MFLPAEHRSFGERPETGRRIDLVACLLWAGALLYLIVFWGGIAAWLLS